MHTYIFRKILADKQEQGLRRRPRYLEKFHQNVSIVYLHKIFFAEPGFSLLEVKFTDRQGKEAEIIHMVME